MKDSTKQEKFLVLKTEDIEKHLPEDYKKKLTEIICIIRSCRNQEGKPEQNKYYVCNQDEKYADLVWGIISFGEQLKKD